VTEVSATNFDFIIPLGSTLTLGNPNILGAAMLDNVRLLTASGTTVGWVGA
jgi:hypothetical protein